MGDISWVGSAGGSNSSLASGATVTVTVPAASAAGDVMVTYQVLTNVNFSLTQPSGSTSFINQTFHGDLRRLIIAWRVVQAGEPGTSLTWTASGALDTTGAGLVTHVFRNVDSAAPINNSLTFSNSTAQVNWPNPIGPSILGGESTVACLLGFGSVGTGSVTVNAPFLNSTTVSVGSVGVGQQPSITSPPSSSSAGATGPSASNFGAFVYLTPSPGGPGEIFEPSSFLLEGMAGSRNGEVFSSPALIEVVPGQRTAEIFDTELVTLPAPFTYRMRAFDTGLGRIVYWNSDEIDGTGTDYTGPGPLTGIVVSEVLCN